MEQVTLKPVNYVELSALRHEIAVSEGATRVPEFLVIRYFGKYRDGGVGRDDALYIVAAAAAARAAWFAYSTILDFRELEYRWGDNMEWVRGITWDKGTRSHWPMAIVVGDHCCDALRSLFKEEYAQDCVDSLEEAFVLCRTKAIEHSQRLKDLRQ